MPKEVKFNSTTGFLNSDRQTLLAFNCANQESIKSKKKMVQDENGKRNLHRPFLVQWEEQVSQLIVHDAAEWSSALQLFHRKLRNHMAAFSTKTSVA